MREYKDLPLTCCIIGTTGKPICQEDHSDEEAYFITCRVCKKCFETEGLTAHPTAIYCSHECYEAAHG